MYRIFWEFDWMIARRIVYLWGSSYYTGQMAKDIFMLPRPPPDLVIDCTTPQSIVDAYYRTHHSNDSPSKKKQGVIRLERHYETEGGMPSTHTMNALSMPWLIVYLVYQRIYNQPLISNTEYNNVHNDEAFVVILIMAILWSVLCILSRLYMGVHSPADMIIGGGIGLIMLYIHIVYGNALDYFILTSNQVLPLSTISFTSISSFITSSTSYIFSSPIYIPIILGILAYIYPRPLVPRWVSTPGDTTLILGVVAGVSMSSIYAVQQVKANLQIQNPNHIYTDNEIIDYLNNRSIHVRIHSEEIIGMFGRFLIGIIILMATRSIVKALSLQVMILLVGHEYAPKNTLDDNMFSDNRHSTHVPSDTTLNPSNSSVVSKLSNNETVRQRRSHVQLSYDDDANKSTSNTTNGETNTLPNNKLSIKAPISSTTNNEMVRIAPSRRYSIELPVKFITYMCVGLNAAYTCHYIYQHYLPTIFQKDYELL